MHIEAYTPRWQEKVCALADSIFGTGYFARPSQIARESDACMCVCVSDDEDIIGFVYGRVLPQGGLREFLEHRVHDIPEDLEAADTAGALGVIQAVAVAPEHRGEGIGTKLLRIAHDEIVGRGGDKLIVTFKRGPGEAHAEALMVALGFERWVRLETYWKERCEQGAFQCVHRKNECGCEAVFYRKAVY